MTTLNSGSFTLNSCRDLPVSLTFLLLLLLSRWDFSGTMTYNNIKNYNETNKNIQTVNIKVRF